MTKPEYYKAGEHDVIAFCQHHGLGFCEGNVIKYVTRAGKKLDAVQLSLCQTPKEIEEMRKKARLQDLEKAQEYLTRLIEFEKSQEEEQDNTPLF